MLKKYLLFIGALLCSLLLSANFTYADEIYQLSKSEVNYQLAHNHNILHRSKSIGGVKAEKSARCYISDIISVSNDFDYKDLSYYKSIKLYNFDNYVCAYWIQYYNKEDETLAYCIVNSESGELIEFGSGVPNAIALLLDEATKNNIDNYKIHISSDYTYYLSEDYGSFSEDVYGINYEAVDYSVEYDEEYLDKSSLVESSKGKLIDNPSSYEFGYNTKTVYNVANYAKATLRTTKYWNENVDSTLKDHCAPTAGTNLIRYYHDFHNLTKLKYKNNWNKTFTRIYNLMGKPGGATRDEIRNGLNTYVIEQLEKKSVYSVWTTITSSGKLNTGGLNSYKERMKSNRPVYVSMYEHHKYTDHGVVGFGYVSYGYTNSSSTYLMIADGWVNSYRYIHTTFGVDNISFLDLII